MPFFYYCDKIYEVNSMKRIIYLGVLSSLMLAACGGESVTPVAYTRYVSSGSQYVYYSSDMYGAVHSQIEVFKNEEEFKKDYGQPELEFRFYRILGKDTLNEVDYTLVDVSSSNIEMTAYIHKDSEIYSATKGVYMCDIPLEEIISA